MERSSSRAQAVPGTATSPTPEKASVWEDFLDIFYAPSAVFARREAGSFLIPMLVVTVLLGVLFIVNSRVMDPIMDAEMRRGMASAMAKNPQITPEMMEQGRGMMSMVAKVSAFIGIPLVIFGTGITLWLVGKLFGAKQTFRAAMVVASYAYVPKVIEGVLAGVQGFFVDPAMLDGRYRLTLGLGRFLDPDTASPVLIGLLGRIDVFTIWVTVLLAIGLSVTGRIPRARAALAAVVVWIIGALPGVYGGVKNAA
jgi:hypothetical protein